MRYIMQLKLDIMSVIRHLMNKKVYLRSSAFKTACKNGNLLLVKFFYEKNIYLNSDALVFASAFGHLDVVSFLCNFYPRNTTYAMNWACRRGHIEIVKHLHYMGFKCGKNIANYVSCSRTSNFLTLIGIPKRTIPIIQKPVNLDFLEIDYTLNQDVYGLQDTILVR